MKKEDTNNKKLDVQGEQSDDAAEATTGSGACCEWQNDSGKLTLLFANKVYCEALQAAINDVPPLYEYVKTYLSDSVPDGDYCLYDFIETADDKVLLQIKLHKSDNKLAITAFRVNDSKQEYECCDCENISENAHTDRAALACYHLTERELEVIKLAVGGSTNRYIAMKLGISEGTVKKQLYNSYRKLGVSSRIELIKRFSVYFD